LILILSTKDENNESPILLPTNCEYNLSGVVIHAGTADSGHYYSLINDEKKNQWIEFNDTTVRPFDVKNLPLEAYGGEDKTPSNLSSNNIKLAVEKCRNAYLLFYKRKEFFNNTNNQLGDESQLCRKDKILGKSPHFLDDIQIDNEKYYLKKYVFELNFSQFIVNLSDLIVSWNPKQKNYLEICRLLFNYFFSASIRSRDKENFPPLYKNLKEILKTSAEVANWFILQLANKEILLETMIDCPFKEIKSLILGLIKQGILTTSKTEAEYEFVTFKTKSILLRILIVCLKLLSETEDRKKSMSQFYLIFPFIISHSPNCMRFLFKEKIFKRLWNYLSNLSEFHDFTPLDAGQGELNSAQEYYKREKNSLNNINDHKVLSYDDLREKKKEKNFFENSNINYSGLIQLWCELALNIRLRNGDNGIINSESVQIKLVLSENIWKRMLQELKNEETKQKVQEFFCFICLKSLRTSQELLNLILNELGDADENDLPLFWGVLEGIVGLNDNYQEVRSIFLIKNFFNGYFKNNLDYYRCIDIGLEWILKVL
jgi:ubiquitin carboxyl-terminal hydrolase 9/24